jgi:NDP-sugar pyrophosphorylase family protein
VMEPAVLDFIPPETYFDFPDLVFALLAAGQHVGAYRYRGLWFDIGRPDDYQAATDAWSSNGNGHGNGNGDGKHLHSLPPLQ